MRLEEKELMRLQKLKNLKKVAQQSIFTFFLQIVEFLLFLSSKHGENRSETRIWN